MSNSIKTAVKDFQDRNGGVRRSNQVVRSGLLSTSASAKRSSIISPREAHRELSAAPSSAIGHAYLSASAEAQEYESISMVDTLTGLASRFACDKAIIRELEGRKRSTSKEVALLGIDLDGFKAVNDALGHDGGDMLLKEVANALKSRFRVMDIVARPGGDEITVIMPFIPNQDEPLTYDVMRKQIDEALEGITRRVGNTFYPISASIGLAVSSDPDLSEIDNVEDLMHAMVKKADKGVYADKAGKPERLDALRSDAIIKTVERMALTPNEPVAA